MRDMFIGLLEKIIHIIVVLGAIGVVIFSVALLMQPPPGVNGVMAFVGALIGGTLYLILVAGFMYLGLGIYQNTRRTADAVEVLAGR